MYCINGVGHPSGSTGHKDIDAATEAAVKTFEDMKFRLQYDLPAKTKSFQGVAELAIKQMQNKMKIGGDGSKICKYYIQHLNNYHIPYFGRKSIDNIQHSDLAGYNEWRIEKMGKVPTKSTVRNQNSAMNIVFRYSLDRGWINEWQIPKLPNTGRKGKKRPYFSDDDLRVMKHKLNDFIDAPGHYNGHCKESRILMREMFYVILSTGMRPGPDSEVSRLKWYNIGEFQNRKGQLFLEFNVNGKTGEREISAPYSLKGHLENIKDLDPEMRNMPFEEACRQDKWLWRNSSGKRVTHLHQNFADFLKWAGMERNKKGERFSLYSLRHSYITRQLLRGIPISVISKQCGNSARMIESHYDHIVAKLAAEQLSGENFWSADDI